MEFKGSHILSVDQLARADIGTIFAAAARMEPFAQRRKVTRVLEGAVLGNLFFEPSTRTRVSFVAAFNRLGGSVSATTGFQFSSMVKGESVYDAGRVMAGYADVLVMRHPVEGAVQEFAGASHVPVINGGDGPGEHPTQALLDLYTIQNETGRDLSALDGLRIAMVGDLRYGRTVHSLTKLLSLFDNVTVVLVAPQELQMPEAITTRVRAKGVTVQETEDLGAGIADVDVVYVTRIQQERFTSPEDADKYRGLYSINRAMYEKYCKPGTVLMHPLPRDSRPGANELDADLNGHPELAIFRQTDNGIPIRMALFALVLGVADRVEEDSRDVRWYVPKRLGTKDTLDYGELPPKRG
jgi:aspartate carbamoyltransferase catalytic subunit